MKEAAKKRPPTKGGFQKGHDPRRHQLGRKKSDASKKKLAAIEKFQYSLTKLDDQAEMFFTAAFSGIDPLDGEKIPWSSRVKLFETWLDRRFGRLPAPESSRTNININSDSVKSLNINDASKLLQELDAKSAAMETDMDTFDGVTIDR